MKRTIRLFAVLALTAALTLGTALPALGAGLDRTDAALNRTVAYVTAAVPSPQVASIGGEWAVLGLARCGRLTQSQRAAYLAALEATLKETQGVLSQRKYSEYSRVVLALSALGEDPARVGGYDLIAPLLDTEMVEWQGINGPIFALLALNSGDYAGEDAKECYLQDILQAQGTDGGWSLAGTRGDPDVTAQALQALAPYEGTNPEAARAVERGLSCLGNLWSAGSFVTSESCSQALIAYAALDRTAPQALVEEFLSYQQSDGSFAHLPGGKSDLMASEQALCALTALARQGRNLFPLYDMTAAGTEQSNPDRLIALFEALSACAAPDPRRAA